MRGQELARSLAKLEGEAAGRHRAQADRVHFWDDRRYLEPKELAGARSGRPGFVVLTPREGEWHVRAHVQNNSDLAIWGLRLEWHLGTIAIGRPDEIPQLAAGKQVTVERPLDPGDGELRFEADLLFRDAAGITWRRKISGELEEIPAPAARSR